LQSIPGVSFNPGEALALAAALSEPAWLEKGERYSMSGGMGFSQDGSTAFGITGIMRVGSNAAAFGSVGASTTHGIWGGRLGARLGW
jgi:hypothetical protein